MTWTLIIIIWFVGNVYHAPQITKVESFNSRDACVISGNTVSYQMTNDKRIHVVKTFCVEKKY